MFRGPIVFLSYAHEDRERVSPIRERLAVLGFRPWMDKFDLKEAIQWEPQIVNAVRRSHFFIIFLSGTSVQKKGYMEDEFKFARQVADQMPSGSLFVLPARLDDCTVPAEIKDLQGANLFENAGFDRMVMAMRSQRVTVVLARFFNRWLRLGLGVSAIFLILALLLSRRFAPFIIEREVVSAVLAVAAGSFLFWFLAGGVLRKTVQGTLVGLAACLACIYVLLMWVDAYPVSDVVRQFSVKNPNGEWSYGYMPAVLGGNFTRFDHRERDRGVEGYSLLVPNHASIPLILHNTKPYTVKRLGGIHLAPNILEMHPGWSGEYAVVRWTAIRAGTYQLTGYFVGLNAAPTTTDVHVILNSQTPLFEAEINSFGVPRIYEITKDLRNGDLIDFRVGNGSNHEPTSDSTGLVAFIRLVE